MYKIQALGTNSIGLSVNESGVVAGFDYQGVLWRSDGTGIIAALDFIEGDPPSVFYSVNNQGDAVGYRGAVPVQDPLLPLGSQNTSTQIPYLIRNGASVPTDLSNQLGQGANCADINDNSILCGSNPFAPWFGSAFVYETYSPGKPTPIPAVWGDYNYAVAINQAAHVVGVVRHRDDTTNGFYFDGVVHDLGPAKLVNDVNDNGQVVGAIDEESLLTPALWAVPKDWGMNMDPQPTPQPIPLPVLSNIGMIAVYGIATSINNSGEIVGSCWTGSDQSAFVYANGVSTDLNTLLITAPGWHLQTANHINDAGMITGAGVLNGVETAFLLTPVPVRVEPTNPTLEAVIKELAQEVAEKVLSELGR